MRARSGPARDIVVVGASAGGVDALARFASGLAPGSPVSTLVVLHLPPLADNRLHEILRRAGHPGVRPAVDRDALRPGEMRVSPPGMQLTVEPARMRVLLPALRQRTCPAVDPLFRSAAAAFGSRVAAVVLSGVSIDGAAGARAVAERGGAVYVQDPDEAHFSAMPESALAAVDDATVGPAATLGTLVGSDALNRRHAGAAA